MMNNWRIFLVIVLLSLCAACGQNRDTAETAGKAVDTADHADHQSAKGDIGHGKGVIRTLNVEGQFLTIEHGPLTGLGMGAMTMGFGTQGDVDLTELAVGDAVAFMVKQSRDGAYRVAAICKPSAADDDCLEKLMAH